MILNYRTQRVMEEHNRKIQRIAEQSESTSKKAWKKKLEEVLAIFQETRRLLSGRRR